MAFPAERQLDAGAAAGSGIDREFSARDASTLFDDGRPDATLVELSCRQPTFELESTPVILNDHTAGVAITAEAHEDVDDNATAAERTLAAVLLLVDHRPDPADRPRLQALQQACNPAPVRILARVLEHLVHIPAAADRAELFELLQGGSDVGPRRSASTR